MHIYPGKITKENHAVLIEYPLSFADGDMTLWYKIDSQYQDFISTILDAPLVALLIPAMTHGEDIHVHGPISTRLFYNLSRSAQLLLHVMLPYLTTIDIFPEEVVSSDTRASGVVTGFSGGVDSFCLLQDHYFRNVPQVLRLHTFLFNNVGSHGRDNEHLFNERYAKNKIVAEKIGLPLIKRQF